MNKELQRARTLEPHTTSHRPTNTMDSDAQYTASSESEGVQSHGSQAGEKTLSKLPPQTLDFAAKCFELARKGDETTLGTYVDAGLPANLTNSQGMPSAWTYTKALNYLVENTRQNLVIVHRKFPVNAGCV